MINRDDGQSRTVALDWDFDGGLVESGVDVVDRDGVVGICSVAANIAYDAEGAVWRLEALLVDEWGDGLGEVDAVYEDVGLDDFWVRPVAFFGFGEVPFLDG